MVIRNFSYFVNFHTSIRIIEINLVNEIYQNVEFIWICKGLEELYGYELVNLTYMLKSCPSFV